MPNPIASAPASQPRLPANINSDPRQIAQEILTQTSGKPATYDKLGQIEARLDDIARTDPALAAQVRSEIMASNRLTPAEKAQLARNEPGTTVNLDGNRTTRFAPDGMAWDPWIDRQRANNTAEFQALARLAGSTQNEPIKAVMRELHARGITAAQLEAERAGASGPSGTTLTLDLVQMALDLTGIVDPTPISDGSNAVISLGRSLSSLFSGEWREAGGHFVNGAISVVGFIPALGDLAKAGKIGKWAQTVADAISMISKNPAMASKLEPALREIRDLVNKIPQSALDALPAGARESLQRMKSQLDEFFGQLPNSVNQSTGTFTGRVRGVDVVLEGIELRSVNYMKRDRIEYTALRNAFDRSIRADFARWLTSSPENLATLRRAGLDDNQIARLAEGKIPQGWQVHHKLPLDDGGTNDFSNLVLIRNDPYHIALTNAQRDLVGDLAVGQSRQVDFPIPSGSVYPPTP